MSRNKDNVIYLSDVIPHVKAKLPTKDQIKMFGYDNAYKLITMTVVGMISIVVSLAANL